MVENRICGSGKNIMLHRTGFKLTTLVMIGTDCSGSCKSNYHPIRPRQPLIMR